MQRSNLKIYVPLHEECNLVTPDEDIVNRFCKYNFESQRAQRVFSAEQADIIIIFEKWSFKLPDYAVKLENSKLIKQFFNKIYVVNYDSVVGEGYLPGCYVSLTNRINNSARFRTCAYPKSYNEFIQKDYLTTTNATYLFSFRGTPHSHPVRMKIFEALMSVKNASLIDITKEFHSHNEEDKVTYINDILSSIFVLCPRGCSPNSYRLFETMSLGRCPVIISDDWLPTPGPDWQSCSIRIKERDISKIPSILNKYKEQGLSMGKNARLEWEKYFSDEKKNQIYLDEIINLHSNNSFQFTNFSSLKKHWNSKKFLYNNGWTFAQKVIRKLKIKHISNK